MARARSKTIAPLAVAVAGALALGCGRRPDTRTLEAAPEDPGSPVFIEATPQGSTAELFGALRALDVDVVVGDDARLLVRMRDPVQFAPACELLGSLHYELEAVDLAWLPIADFSPIFHLRSVERVDLRGTAIADLHALRHLGALRSLSLAETDIDSLAPLAELPALESLDLSSARADLRGLAAVSSLRHLDLSLARTAPRGFEVRDGEGLDLAGLRPHEGLESLRLTATKDRDWGPMRELWTLRQLDLSYTNFQELGLLAGFSDLETLDLRRTAVADPWPLLQLEQLRRVDLRDCELLDPRDVDGLVAMRPDMEILF